MRVYSNTRNELENNTHFITHSLHASMVAKRTPDKEVEGVIEIEVIEDMYAGITFGANYGNDFEQDFAIAEQLYANMMGWA